MRFCVFLAEEKLLTDRECMQVLRTISRRTPPLGKLLLRARLLTMAQLGELLQDQVQSDLPLGQLSRMIENDLLQRIGVADLRPDMVPVGDILT